MSRLGRRMYDDLNTENSAIILLPPAYLLFPSSDLSEIQFSPFWAHYRFFSFTRLSCLMEGRAMINFGCGLSIDWAEARGSLLGCWNVLDFYLGVGCKDLYILYAC